MNLKDSQKLKGLQSQKIKLEVELRYLVQETIEVRKEVNSCRQEMSALDKQIETIQEKTKDLIVSEHTVILYLERTMGLDLNQIKREILAEEVVE